MGVVFPPLPKGKFRVVLCDPPWTFSPSPLVKTGWATKHYDCVKLPDLCSLPVRDIGLPDSVIFMWTPCSMIEQSLTLMKSWGYKYRTMAFVWNKLTRRGRPFFGMGYYTRAGSEVCLLGTRGKVHQYRKSGSIRQVITSTVGRHSQKPDESYDRIEALFPGPYIELFARGSGRPGWEVWGLEAENGGVQTREAVPSEAIGVGGGSFGESPDVPASPLEHPE